MISLSFQETQKETWNWSNFYNKGHKVTMYYSEPFKSMKEAEHNNVN